MNLIKDEIVSWIKNYADNSGLNCLVVGVSGGIDSAVVSTLCSLTGLKTVVINMPINSKDENTNLSNLQCNWLTNNFSNVEKRYIELSDVYNLFKNQMAVQQFDNKLADANCKSRLRMVTLYYIAGSNSALVVGTGNKVEDFGVGFYTKYGDGGVDISPIADLTKTQVRNLAAHLGIPNEIIEAPPTDGLWEDSRTDEEQIGASYEELEWAMEYLASEKDVDLSAREQEVLEIYNKFHNSNKHKMEPIPVFKLSSIGEQQ